MVLVDQDDILDLEKRPAILTGYEIAQPFAVTDVSIRSVRRRKSLIHSPEIIRRHEPLRIYGQEVVGDIAAKLKRCPGQFPGDIPAPCEESFPLR